MCWPFFWACDSDSQVVCGVFYSRTEFYWVGWGCVIEVYESSWGTTNYRVPRHICVILFQERWTSSIIFYYPT